MSFGTALDCALSGAGGRLFLYRLLLRISAADGFAGANLVLEDRLELLFDCFHVAAPVSNYGSKYTNGIEAKQDRRYIFLKII